MNNKTAILLGATGLTGSLLLKRLLKDDNYSKIKLFSRSESEIKSPNIEEFLGDILQLENFKNEFTGDVVFCCIGTTKAKTKEQAKYKAIDYGIPLAAAKLAKQNNIDTIVVISSMGADEKSAIFYNRTKGQMENAVLSQEIKHTHILRPSLITGNRDENRTLEKIGATAFKALGFLMIGPLKKYKAIEADTIAKAMINIDKTKPAQQIIESDDIVGFS
jgi:uncharacterized protein YbjT (DUF2867 family)